MAKMLQLGIDETVSASLRRIITALPAPEVLFKVWAQRVVNDARASARSKGGRRFWRDVARATHVASVSYTGAIVVNDHIAGAFKQTGGTIYPRQKKELTIPFTEEAKRKRAAEFELGGRDLFVIVGKTGSRILGYSDDGEFHALYVLKSSVRIPADPWFPESAGIGAVGLEEGLRMLSRAGL